MDGPPALYWIRIITVGRKIVGAAIEVWVERAEDEVMVPAKVIEEAMKRGADLRQGPLQY